MVVILTVLAICTVAVLAARFLALANEDVALDEQIIKSVQWSTEYEIVVPKIAAAHEAYPVPTGYSSSLTFTKGGYARCVTLAVLRHDASLEEVSRYGWRLCLCSDCLEKADGKIDVLFNGFAEQVTKYATGEDEPGAGIRPNGWIGESAPSLN